MRQMANHEMKNLSPVDSDLPSRIAPTNSIILAASWRRLMAFRTGRAIVVAAKHHDTIAKQKKQS
jgi:hypothetical protein